MLLRSIINSKKTVRERHKKNLRTVQHISRLSRRSAPSVNRVEYAAVKSNFHAINLQLRTNVSSTSKRFRSIQHAIHSLDDWPVDLFVSVDSLTCGLKLRTVVLSCALAQMRLKQSSLGWFERHTAHACQKLPETATRSKEGPVYGVMASRVKLPKNIKTVQNFKA